MENWASDKVGVSALPDPQGLGSLVAPTTATTNYNVGIEISNTAPGTWVLYGLN